MELTLIEKVVLACIAFFMGGAGLFVCWASIKLFEVVVAGKYS